MSLLNNSRERFPGEPRPLTPQRLEAVEARMPIRLKAAQNVWQTTKMSFPELWEPAPALPQVEAVQPPVETKINAPVVTPEFSPAEWARKLVDDAFKDVEPNTAFADSDMQQAATEVFDPNVLGDSNVKETA